MSELSKNQCDNNILSESSVFVNNYDKKYQFINVNNTERNLAQNIIFSDIIISVQEENVTIRMPMNKKQSIWEIKILVFKECGEIEGYEPQNITLYLLPENIELNKVLFNYFKF